GIDRGRGQITGLPHATAQDLPDPDRPLDRLRTARQGRAHRAAQSLTETDADGIEKLSMGLGVIPFSDQGVPQPGPIQMVFQVPLPAELPDFGKLFKVPTGPAP